MIKKIKKLKKIFPDFKLFSSYYIIFLLIIQKKNIDIIFTEKKNKYIIKNYFSYESIN